MYTISNICPESNASNDTTISRLGKKECILSSPLGSPSSALATPLPASFNGMTTNGKMVRIHIRKLDTENREEHQALARVMAKTFVDREPTTKAVNLTEEEFYDEIVLYLEYARKDDVSLVLINEETGQVIGGIIGRDFIKDNAEDAFEHLPNRQKFQPVFDFLDQSKEKLLDILRKEQCPLEPGYVYRGFFIGFMGKYLTLKNEDGIGVAQFSFRQFEEYLKGRGFRYFYGEATNPGSQKLFAASGWTIHEIVVPYNSDPRFAHIDFKQNALPGIGNALSGAIQRVGATFPPLSVDDTSHYTESSQMQLGFPHNLDFQYSQWGNYLDFHINNAGDPENHSNYQIHAREQEKAVLNFFANHYSLPLKEVWGYIASGGTEANEMGLYLGRTNYPSATLYASTDSHYSVRVCADKLKMPLCEIPSLAHGEIDYAVFEQKIAQTDTPAVIVLNIGTTMKGAIDSVRTVVDILNKLGKKDFYIHCDAALHGGFLPFLTGASHSGFDLPIHSVSISLHKFLGVPFPSAVFLGRKAGLDALPDNLVKTHYNGTKTHTLSCSRNGHSALFAYKRLLALGGERGLSRLAADCMEVAEYTVMRLKAMDYPKVLRNPYSNVVVLATPPASVYKKWQLSVNRDLAHIITMPHVTKDVVDAFICDLQQALAEQVSLHQRALERVD
ncbi:MAG: hdc, histidine decarboxylase [Rickettsiales bacterium]|nr:hdc, histidine decarboxylase [Rickettsiales bacterium]